VPLSPDLWDSIVPPAVWVTLASLECPESDTRTANVRIKEEGRRSISATGTTSRYSPESSIFFAISKMVDRLQVLQVPLNREVLQDELDRALRTWVDPF
jgi:hypothetical protein